MTHLAPAPQPQPSANIPVDIPVPGSGRRVQYSPSDLLAVLNELAELLEKAKPVMLSKDIRVNRETAIGLIDELRGSMPVAVEQADEALTAARNQLAAANSQAEAVVAGARAEADSILAAVRQRQVEMVEREAVVAQAKGRAAEIQAAAKAEADQLKLDADAYCDARLAAFSNDLAALQKQVAAGRARLAQSLEPTQGRAHPQPQPPAPASMPVPANAAKSAPINAAMRVPAPGAAPARAPGAGSPPAR